jgi:hypothetical protein
VASGLSALLAGSFMAYHAWAGVPVAARQDMHEQLAIR